MQCVQMMIISNIMKAENKSNMDDSFDKQKLEEDPNDSDLRKMSGYRREEKVCSFALN